MLGNYISILALDFSNATTAVVVQMSAGSSVNWHQRFIDNCIQQCRNLAAVCNVYGAAAAVAGTRSL